MKYRQASLIEALLSSGKFTKTWFRPLAVAFLILISSGVVEARPKPPYSPDGFINHINTNVWHSRLFQYIDPSTPKECYELKPQFGTWGGITKGRDEIWFSPIKNRYVGPWGYGCFFGGPATFTLGGKGTDLGQSNEIWDQVNYLYWNDENKTYYWNGYRSIVKKPFQLSPYAFSEYMNGLRFDDDEYESNEFNLEMCSITTPGANSDKILYYCASGYMIITGPTPRDKRHCDIISAYYTINGEVQYEAEPCRDLLPFAANPTAFQEYLNRHMTYDNKDVDFISLASCSEGDHLYACTSGQVSINSPVGLFTCDVDYVLWTGTFKDSNCRSMLPFETAPAGFRNYLNGLNWKGMKEVFFHSLGTCSYRNSSKKYSCENGNVVIKSWRGVKRCEVDVSYQFNEGATYSANRCIKLDWAQQALERIERLGLD